MENFPNKGESLKSPEKISIPIEVRYSVTDEVSRVRRTIDKYPWFKENGYRPTLPQEIKDRLESGGEVSDDDIRSVVENEYQDDVYLGRANKLREEWEMASEDFLGKLKTLGRPLVKEYKISITRYGTGGSYGYPNSIQLNVGGHSKLDALQVSFHEMVHLAIQDLIEKYNIPHWTKERLVDLTMNKFFPDKEHLQRDIENAEKVGEIFEGGFPDIEKIISEVSKLNPSTKVA